MRNVVFVLGAGASFDYHAPLMKDFYRVATSLYVDPSANSNLRKNFDIVFSLIDQLQKAQAKSNIDLHNIESVYTALEMAKLLKLDELKSTKKQGWKEIDEAMKYFLAKSIESQIVLPYSDKLPRMAQSNRNRGFDILTPSSSSGIDHVVEQALGLVKKNWQVTFITVNRTPTLKNSEPVNRTPTLKNSASEYRVRKQDWHKNELVISAVALSSPKMPSKAEFQARPTPELVFQ